MDKSDEQIILDGIQLVGPAQNREISAAMRASLRQVDPEQYASVAAQHPLLFGPDSLERIRLEFPELWPPAKTPTP